MTSGPAAAKAIAIALTGTLALGGAVTAQDEAAAPPAEETATMAAPAFEWQRTNKLPGLGKLANSGCPVLMEDATFTESGTAVVIGADIWCGAAGANAWRSDDGSKWKQEKLGFARPAGLIATESGVVAVGSAPTQKGSNALAWSSEDGAPLKKAATVKNASFSDIIATPDGYQAVGVTKYKQGYGFPAVWTSADGKDWGSAVQLGDKRGFPPLAAIGPADVRLVADPSSKEAVLWRSEDGVEWEELGLPGEVRGKKDVSIWHLEGDGSGFLMTLGGLGRGQFSPQLWRSGDGREWLPAAAPAEHVMGLAVGPLGHFAFTTPPSDKKGNFKKGKPGVLLWSADGSVWCRMEIDDLARVEVNGSDVAPDGRMLITGAAGQHFTGSPFVLMGTPIEGQTVPCEPVPAPEGLPETVTFTAPIIEPPSMVSACSDPEAKASAGASMYCISDLVKAGSRKTKPAKALKAAPSYFAKSACVKPAGGAAKSRAMLCLEQIARSWRQAQREAEADGMVTKKAYQQVLPTYQWAANTLSKADKDYLDRGLSKLDRTPIGWEREKPRNLKKASTVRKAATRNTSADALRKTLQAAWLQSDMAPILDAVVEMPGGWEQPDVPSGPLGPGYPSDYMSYWVGPKGGSTVSTDLVSKCELALNPGETPKTSGSIRTETCGVTAAKAWLLYLATGDQRFIDVAVGIRDMTMRASSAEGLAFSPAAKEKLFFQTFDCWAGVTKNASGCYSGL